MGARQRYHFAWSMRLVSSSRAPVGQTDRATSASRLGHGDRTAWFATGAFLAVMWGLVFYHIHVEWTVNVVYSYGWAVPFLALYLGWERWTTRPLPDYPPARGVVTVIAILLVLAYFPTRVVQEANPDWVKVNWTMMSVAALITLLAAWSTGGKRYVKHFAFAVLFCFTALPWPIWFETALVQNLMRVNADLCAEILTIGGLPALATGNIIQVGHGSVNVEEACSGIRSLQTAFMMSLFLGEFHGFRIARRGAILLMALGVAFLINMARTIVLAYLSTRDALERWHDTVGNVGMVVTLALVWLSAEILRRKQPAAAVVKVASYRRESMRAPFAVALTAMAIVGLFAAEFLTERWYHMHEAKVASPMKWNIAWPNASRNFRHFPFNERTLALLKFDKGDAAVWTDDTGYKWQAYLLEWKPGRVSKYLAMSHYPTVCLPAAGLELSSESGPWDPIVKGVRIPFRTYIFQEEGRDVYVFHAIMEDHPLEENFTFRYYQVTSNERLASVLRGERNLGQRVLGLAVRGCTSPVEAHDLVASMLEKLIQQNRKDTVAAHERSAGARLF